MILLGRHVPPIKVNPAICESTEFCENSAFKTANKRHDIANRSVLDSDQVRQNPRRRRGPSSIVRPGQSM